MPALEQGWANDWAFTARTLIPQDLSPAPRQPFRERQSSRVWPQMSTGLSA